MNVNKKRVENNKDQMGDIVVFEVDGNTYTPISTPLEYESDADSFIETMKEGMYYKSIRPDLRLVGMKIVTHKK